MPQVLKLFGSHYAFCGSRAAESSVGLRIQTWVLLLSQKALIHLAISPALLKIQPPYFHRRHNDYQKVSGPVA